MPLATSWEANVPLAPAVLSVKESLPCVPTSVAPVVFKVAVRLALYCLLAAVIPVTVRARP